MKPSLLAAASAILLAGPAAAREFYVGGPVQKYDMEIVANYLLGIQMAPMTPDTTQGDDVIHVEADVKATADNANGFPDGAWIPALTIDYRLEKEASPWRAEGKLRAMQAKDGPHYADNVKMGGPGRYTLTYRFSPPDTNGFLRHVDQETGVPPWWQPFTTTFSFQYPQQ